MGITSLMPAGYPRTTLALAATDRIVVVAPHPDDDVLGCGAVMTCAARLGARVDVVYVTDGSFSHPRSLRFPPVALAALRAGEAREGLRRMGVAAQRAHFLDAPDGACERLAVAERSRLLERLRERLDALVPSLVLAPWQRDPHPDHRATAALVAAALPVCARRARLLQYAVWLDVRGSAAERPRGAEVGIVDFPFGRDVAVVKRSAIAAHASQTTELVDDDAGGFRIAPQMVERVCTSPEPYFEAARG